MHLLTGQSMKHWKEKKGGNKTHPFFVLKIIFYEYTINLVLSRVLTHSNHCNGNELPPQ